MNYFKWLAVAVIASSGWMFAADSSSAAAKRGARCRDEIKANGAILVGEGREKAKFKVDARDENGNSSGRIDYRDRDNGLTLRSRNLISYEAVDTETRRLTFDLGGSDDTNVVNTAVVTLRDLGRGRNDFFEIAAGEYFASGNLRNGQVRLRDGSGCDDVIEEPVE